MGIFFKSLIKTSIKRFKNSLLILTSLGITAVVGGRPKPVPCLKLFSFLYPKSKMDAKTELDGQVVNDA